MDHPTADADPSERPARGSKAVLVVAAAVAFLVPWATQFGGPAWGSTNVPLIVVWLVVGVCGVALLVAGGRVRRIGVALIAGVALGALLFFLSFVVVIAFTYGDCGTCG